MSKKRKGRVVVPTTMATAIPEKAGNNKKIRVLAYCDSPSCATGFGTVSRNIFEGLYKSGKYDIDILGINYWGDPHNLPYRIWPVGTNSQKDPYGRQKVVAMIPQMEFDVLFFLQDSFIMNFLPTLIPHLKTNRQKPFKSLLYFPVDSIIKEDWAKNVNQADYLVAYSEFGKQEFLKRIDREDVNVIPHGVNTKEYYPLPNDEVMSFKKQFFGKYADHFIITNLNRNQQRKDIPRTIAAFKEFRKQVPKSVLYLHMAIKDQGWDLAEVCKAYELDTAKDVIFPQNFGPNQGYPRQVVNLIYNASDVVISTTLGEGFGLAWMEAMAAGTSIVMPANTMLPEFIAEENGYLCKSGSNPSLYTTIQFDNEVIRPLTDVDDLVRVLVHIHDNPAEAAQKAENGYKWITTNMDWLKHIVPQWVTLFEKSRIDMQSSVLSPAESMDAIKGIGKQTIASEEF